MNGNNAVTGSNSGRLLDRDPERRGGGPAAIKVPGRGKGGARNPADMRWSDLMARGRAGDRRAYDRLLGELRPWLCRYFARRLPAIHVDDAVQETLIAVHNRRHDFDITLPFHPWLAAIARFKWVDRLRMMEREQTALDAEPTTPSHEIDIVSCHVVGRLLGGLRPAQAEAIRLVKMNGLSIIEASAQTGQSQSLVKVNIHRGLKRLAGLLVEPAPALADAVTGR
ncbi:sigma-70 family RNA polymerase sigma factor [Sphingomonas changnyeongensis]|nr:sigma-70 family RNA polymerase sigma factor [Sphingomonas changnyeongensis]